MFVDGRPLEFVYYFALLCVCGWRVYIYIYICVYRRGRRCFVVFVLHVENKCANNEVRLKGKFFDGEVI